VTESGRISCILIDLTTGSFRKVLLPRACRGNEGCDLPGFPAMLKAVLPGRTHVRQLPLSEPQLNGSNWAIKVRKA
jgi:hypothetical protein